MIKDNTDLWAVLVGTTASLMKGLKRKLKAQQLIIALITGGVLAWGTLGIIDMFFGELEPKVIMLVSFAVGWVANEITDVLDDTIKDAYELVKQWAKSKLKK
jgi:hypothetical protein